MSDRTFESRLARWRASVMEDLRRRSSRRWSRRISRWRTRLLDFRAEVVRGDSESRRRASWVMSASRWIAGESATTRSSLVRDQCCMSYVPSRASPGCLPRFDFHPL